MRLGRLNGDATWWVEFGGLRVVFDPWLSGSDIEYFRWFSEAWHSEPVIDPSEAGRYDLAVVSQAFNDHLQPDTLVAMDLDRIACVPGCGLPNAAAIPLFGDAPLEVGEVRIWRLTRPWWHPPRYHAIVLADAGDSAVVHAPHGLPVDVCTVLAERFRVELFAVSRMRFELPLVLGGAVNPGNDAAVAAVRASGARQALCIHDEDKRSEGLVSRLATVRRGPYPEDGIDWIEPGITPP